VEIAVVTVADAVVAADADAIKTPTWEFLNEETLRSKVRTAWRKRARPRSESLGSRQF